MSFFEIFIGVIAWLLIGVVYYAENIRPHYPRDLFNSLMRDFSEVKNGSKTYYYFANHYLQECSIINQKDSKELIDFKKMLLMVLPYEDFMRKHLTEPDITLYRLENAIMSFTPSIDASEIVTKLSSNKKLKEIMDKLVNLGYCNPNSYRWNEKYSSYLMALFYDAISQELNHTRGLWASFNILWGNEGKRNLSSLKNQALASPQSNELIETVKTVFPNYDHT